MLGSCFADNIGKYLKAWRFNIVVNPNGTTYNPISIANILEQIMSDKPYNEEDLIFTDNRWVSFMHHSIFSAGSKEELIDKITENHIAAATQLRNATHIILTFGSSYVYEHDGKIINNCHKLPAREFTERQMSIEEIVEKYSFFIPQLRKLNANAEIILTVSPVKYLGRGAHAGQINKATLLLAAENIFQLFKNERITYFPSYEIMTDELRDYRFYKTDMTHPSDLAIEYICERFKETYLTLDARSTIDEIEKVNKALSHRPLNPDSETYKRFVENTNNNIARLKAKYPCIKF